MVAADSEKVYEKVPTSELEKLESAEIPTSLGWGARHVQCLIIFGCLAVSFLVRAQLSVVIVAMTDVKNDSNSVSANVTFDINGTDIINGTIFGGDFNRTEEELNLNVNGSLGNDTRFKFAINRNNSVNASDEVANGIDTNSGVYRTYNWPKSTQEMVMGAFFLGYTITMAPMGLIVQRYGGKIPLQIGLFVSGIFTFLTPWLAAWGDWKAVAVSRAACGLAQAGTYPGVQLLVAKWVPQSERGRLATYVYIGSMLGSVVALQLGGILSSSALGWPSMQWLTGILSIIMAILLTLFGAATPQLHKTITVQERNFILGKLSPTAEKVPKTPWKAIFTSVPVWATFVAHAGTDMVSLFFFSQIPTYLHYINGIDIKNSGLLSSMPYIANFLTSIVFGQLCDYLTNNKKVTNKQARILFNSIANVWQGLSLCALSFIDNTYLAVACLMSALAAQAGIHPGWMISYIDLAPAFSSTLMATGNTLTNLTGLLIPVLVSSVVTDMTDIYQWRIVMFILAAICITCNLIYSLFISGDIQEWNYPDYKTKDLEDAEDEKLNSTDISLKNNK